MYFLRPYDMQINSLADNENIEFLFLKDLNSVMFKGNIKYLFWKGL